MLYITDSGQDKKRFLKKGDPIFIGLAKVPSTKDELFDDFAW
jgi:hypothetical protein